MNVQHWIDQSKHVFILIGTCPSRYHIRQRCEKRYQSFVSVTNHHCMLLVFLLQIMIGVKRGLWILQF